MKFEDFSVVNFPLARGPIPLPEGFVYVFLLWAANHCRCSNLSNSPLFFHRNFR